MGGITVQPNEITEVLQRPISQELLARDPAWPPSRPTSTSATVSP
jgi:hypothetical protein